MDTIEKLVNIGVKQGCLDLDHHDVLIKRILFFSHQTRVPPQYILTSSAGKLNHELHEKCQAWRQHETGFVVYGEADTDIQTQFFFAAGIFLRNHFDARVFTTEEVVKQTQNDEAPDCSVLFLPDFVSGMDMQHDWVQRIALSMLQQRRGHFTILYGGTSKSGVKNVWGKAVRQWVQYNLTEVEL